jgi:Na+/melibiose symporter-like transporter
MLDGERMKNQTGEIVTGVWARRFGSFDYVKITALGFGLTALWSSLHSIILPIRLLDFAPAALKNTYLGYMTFSGLVLAMLVQPIVGTISDRSGFAWGRRRPFVLIGISLGLVLLPGTGLWASYAALFAVYCLLQIACNTAQGPYQGLIPDLVPEDKRGRASGVKSLLELLGGIMLIRLIAYFMGNYSAVEGHIWLWLSLGTLGIIVLGTALVILLTVREEPGVAGQHPPLLTSLYKGFQINLKQNRSFVWFMVFRGLVGIPGVILQTFALYYLMDVIGIEKPAAVTADLMIVVGVSLIAVVYFAGRFSDRTGRKPILVGSGILGALGIVALYFSRSYVYILFSGAILGIANGALLSTSWALATDLVPEGEEAKYLGMANLALAGGSAVARLIGPVIDFFNNLGPNLGYSVMLLACFVCFVIGTISVWRIKESR